MREGNQARSGLAAANGHPGFSWPAQVLIGLVVTTALVVVAYFFVDLPVLHCVRGCKLNYYRFLKWLTRPPEVFVILSPFVLLACLLRQWFAPWTRLEKVAAAAAASTLFTVLAALILKISFGRYCPDGKGYGFNPFHFGSAYWAFPSGHTACTVSVTAVVRVAVPRWRLCCWSVAGIVGAAMIALNYHFIGDILGGAFLGWAIAGTAARLFGLKPSTSTEPVDGPRHPFEWLGQVQGAARSPVKTPFLEMDTT